MIGSRRVAQRGDVVTTKCRVCAFIYAWFIPAMVALCLLALCVVFLDEGKNNMPLVQGRVFAYKGEWITHAETDVPICELTRDLRIGDILRPSICAHWDTLPVQPYVGMVIGPDTDWIRTGSNGIQMHLPRGWVP